ncbi:NACHT domain-containing protein [Streptomyces sp. NPDC002755]|uniref:NACHT domain-containing protein n=1 Tax=Streptomyces sp. NPDC002884 TaxID=3154544 RepID=UPI00333427BE
MLWVVGLISALVVARRFDLGVAQTAAAALATLAPGYLAWAAFHADRVEAAPADEDKILEQLAVAVRTQWDNEAAVRRVNDPYPLPVAWETAGDELSESWALLTGLACGRPGGPPGDPGLWPADPAGLAGQDAEIGHVFSDRTPTRRLVILGEPGAGKSVLLVRLLQDLIARRTAGDPVPVLFSLASWDPRQPLKTWMAGQLRRAHPGLATAAPPSFALMHAIDGQPGDLAMYLLNAGRILPLLDGFDELPPARHVTALDTLNRALPARQPVVLTSRTGPYRMALTRPGTTARLNGASAIRLLPLKAQDAADYLRRDAGSPDAPAAHRWNQVIAHLGTTSPVGEVLATPLGLFLARTIYNPRPGTAASPLAPHPDELCNAAAYPDPTALNTHLFHAFIPAAYASQQPRPPRWTADQAHRAFVFLARFQQHQRAGSPDIAWWELPKAIPKRTRRLVFGLATGLPTGITAGLVTQPLFGLMAGFVAGLVTVTAAGLMTAFMGAGTPRVRLRLALSAHVHSLGLVFVLGLWLVASLVIGTVVGLVAVLNGIGTAHGLWLGIMSGFLVGSAALFMSVLVADAPDLTASPGPVTLFASDRRTFLTFMLTVAAVFGIIIALPSGIVVGSVFGILLGVAAGLVFGIAAGLASGIVFGVVGGLIQTAWGYFVISCAFLAVRRKIPRHLMAFLQDAHEHRGVLRQAGAVYQFRHIDLQRHLAQ